MTPMLNADSTGPKICKYAGLLCLQWIFWIRPWPDLEPDLTGSNGPQIRIQRAQKHKVHVVWSTAQYTFLWACVIKEKTWSDRHEV